MTWLKVDLHTHTSEDPQDRITYNSYQLIDRAVLKGFDAIAITNHDFLFYPDDLVEYAEDRGILLIPGMELTLSKKHVLLINPDFPSNPKGRPLSDLEKIKNNSNLIIAPHPFFPQLKSLKSNFFSYFSYFDAVEFSHCYTRFFNPNKKAVFTAKKYDIPLVGTSDCHFLWEFGTTYSYIEAEKTIPSIIHAVKKKKVRLVSFPLSIHSSFRLSIDIAHVKLKKIFSQKESTLR
ncbi:MAG TPA: hypothetical protein ENN58_01450 [bacterium]|nr:hypothetical protein [bacterium]